MEDKVKQRLEECGLTESQLTKELDKLKEEIKAEEEGYSVLTVCSAIPHCFIV